MHAMYPMHPTQSPLGQPARYANTYDPKLLFQIPRQDQRDTLGIAGTLPFFGVDVWNAYEVSWLNLRGKPQVGIVHFSAPADSPYIIESKSLKLYLNSFNQTPLADAEALLTLLRQDLSAGFGSTILPILTLPQEFSRLRMEEFNGLLLDRLDIEVTHYAPNPALLSADHTCAPIEETLVSHLLKSNCLVTGQPDWASVQIHYIGAPIDQENLLKYIISFRDHNEFHEQCVERIFMDILRQCAPQKLAVYARYTRRGGIDINPWRSNFTTKAPPNNARQARQ